MKVQRLIIDTFIKMGNDNGFDDITIKKIVKECNISRNSFYYYFYDLQDVIRFYMSERFSDVISVWNESEDIRTGVEYITEKIVYNWPELKKLLNSKWRSQTEFYLHECLNDLGEKAFATKRKKISFTYGERMFLTRFIAGGIYYYIIYGHQAEVDIETFAEQLDLLMDARRIMQEKEK